MTAPTISDVQGIGALEPPALRNLLITQCYWEISKAFSERTGICANWCTFATWASRQAGVTIRGEDIKRKIELTLKNEPEILKLLHETAARIKGMGFKEISGDLENSLIAKLVSSVITATGDAVARGNQKVFQEIAHEFARFIASCFTNANFDQHSITGFCAQLKSGDPPDGQDYLKRAFTGYYQSFFEQDKKKRIELQLLANIEIGYHEQTRLQPEIAESLNSGLNADDIKKFVADFLFDRAGIVGKVIYGMSVLRGKKSLLNNTIERLVGKVQLKIRTLISAELMTLTVPPSTVLQLGSDLDVSFPEELAELSNPELIKLLTSIDPTSNSLRLTGATDWADLKERLHFIADMFRCFHLRTELFDPAFTLPQLNAMRSGNMPQGRL